MGLRHSRKISLGVIEIGPYGVKLSITCLRMFRNSVVHVQLVSQSIVLLQYTAWFSPPS